MIALESFHFLRPAWLLLMPVVGALCLYQYKQSRSAGWRGVIDDGAIKTLTVRGNASLRSRFLILFLALCLTSIALAGPTWTKQSHALTSARHAVVFVLDLSPSMRAKDLKPDRLSQARFKLHDLLAQRGAGDSALVVYAAEAYRIAPLTDDPATIQSLLSVLHPDIMPRPGSQVEHAIALAQDILAGADQEHGDIVLITDGVHDDAMDTIKAELPEAIRLSVLGIGTTEGAVIPAADNTVLLDAENQPVIARLNEKPLKRWAQELGGIYASLTTNSADVQHLLAATERLQNHATRDKNARSEQWQDMGYWIVLPLLVFAALAFQRRLLWVTLPALLAPWLLMGVAAWPTQGQAADWINPWLNPDQQAMQRLNAGDAAGAAELFRDADWRRIALYRNKEYSRVIDSLGRPTTPQEFFLLGNAYAQLMQYEKAIKAYQQVLLLSSASVNKITEDARFNLALLQASSAETDDDLASQNNPEEPQPADPSVGESAEQSNNGVDVPAQALGGVLGGADSLDQAAVDDQGQSVGEQVRDQDSEVAKDASAQSDNAQPGSTTESSGEPDRAEQTLFEENQNSVLNPYAEQWLRTLPQDPAGYLRRKLAYQAQLNSKEPATQTDIEQRRY